MHQSVIKVTRWNLKVISLRIPLQNKDRNTKKKNLKICTGIRTDVQRFSDHCISFPLPDDTGIRCGNLANYLFYHSQPLSSTKIRFPNRFTGEQNDL